METEGVPSLPGKGFINIPALLTALLEAAHRRSAPFDTVRNPRGVLMSLNKVPRKRLNSLHKSFKIQMYCLTILKSESLNPRVGRQGCVLYGALRENQFS